jgi:omega-amidase
MGNTLTISLIQLDLVWEDVGQNLAKFENIIEELPSTDIIVLPELFTTGFTMSVEPNAEEVDGPSVKWMISMAKKYSVAICGRRSHLF